MAKGRTPRPPLQEASPPTIADRMEQASYAIEHYSPWYGFVERLRKLRFGAWTIRYWHGGWRFRWRMLRTALTFGALAALVVALLTLA